MLHWPTDSRNPILFRLGCKGKCNYTKWTVWKLSSVGTGLRSTQVQPLPVSCLLPTPPPPSLVLFFPHPEKAWPGHRHPFRQEEGGNVLSWVHFWKCSEYQESLVNFFLLSLPEHGPNNKDPGKVAPCGDSTSDRELIFQSAWEKLQLWGPHLRRDCEVNYLSSHRTPGTDPEEPRF